jgi:hypothetical protein
MLLQPPQFNVLKQKQNKSPADVAAIWLPAVVSAT